MSDDLRRLISQVTKFVAEDMDEAWEEALGDSPIERLLYSAVRARIMYGNSEIRNFYQMEDWVREAMTKGRESHLVGDLVVEAQVQFEWGRVDFVFHAYDFGRKGDVPRWKKLIVECDGHDFHERTKEQATRDKSRDRQAQLKEIEIFRFTGSEIWKDPWESAGHIIEWATRGWP